MHKPSIPLTVSEVVRRVASQDPASKTWTCSHCGEIPARELRQAPGYYIRRSCPCEERERERQAQRLRQDEQALTTHTHIYTWMGRDWADLALRDKTFATFERDRQPEAFEAAQAFAIHPRGNLVLFGGYG